MISFNMSSTERGPAKWDPKGHSSSFLVFAVSSYLPSSPLLTRPSFTISSSIGYTEPGEGLHHPCVMFSISSIISIPFLGERLTIVRIKGLSPRLRKCPNPRNIRYRFSDIGYPIPNIRIPFSLATSLVETIKRSVNRPFPALNQDLNRHIQQRG